MATSPTGGLRLPWPAPLFFFFFFLLSPLALAVAQELPPGFPGDMPLPGDMPQISMGFMDGLALLIFKKYLGNTSLALSSWTHGDPCDKTRPPWAGVICTGGAVTGIRLRGKGLFGTINETAIDPLTHIAGLRTIGLSNNDFSGEIPPLSRLVALKSIFLSNNRFSGVIDGDYFSDMTHLKKVWLAGNSFTGKIPPSLTKLPHLMELHLENNQFSGGLPAMNIPTLSSFNVSNNRFEGAVPAALRKFGDSAFKGNAGLCFPQAGNNSCATAAAAAASPGEDKEVRSWRAVMVGIVLGTLLLALIAGLFIIKKRRRGVFDTLGVEHGGAGLESARMPPAAGGGGQGGSERHGNSSRRTSSGGHKRHDSSSRKGSVHSKSSASSDSSELGELVLLNPEKAGTLVMADLMKAAAEVLGSSPLGTTYKVILTDGGAVAVKRLRDLHRMGKDGFEAEIRRLGRLRHPNVLPPLAYHYDKKEKLVLFEYVDKGSLLYALHGDRGAHHRALTWPTRLRIVRGIARGMAYLHSELAASDVPHGNLKSCNVLLGPTYEPLLIDYGLTPLVNPSQAAISMFAYRSPEAAQRRQVSPKCDVYCLGVVVLEVVTGKFPSQYLSSGMGGTDVVEWVAAAAEERREAELIDPEIAAGGGAKRSTASIERLLRIAAACTDPRPENRPSMKEAARRIEAVTVDGSIAADDDSGAAAAAPLKEGHAVLTTRLSARERSGETFGIS
ncbi:unnamed protein product [Spirodela intermedia]|uniref:Protein kinase domain-containing protein n=1 Tax=Spirodela intermedia TaxID=51605 RepID=A0A7I8KTQ3_SPIIN|nr:unnamed protein product [Spirodela intermedia]